MDERLKYERNENGEVGRRPEYVDHRLSSSMVWMCTHSLVEAR